MTVPMGGRHARSGGLSLLPCSALHEDTPMQCTPEPSGKHGGAEQGAEPSPMGAATYLPPPTAPLYLAQVSTPGQ